MKYAIPFIALLYFLNTNISYSQNYFEEFSKTEFNCAGEDLNFFLWMFESKDHLKYFLDIKKGDAVVEVGAGTTVNIGILSMIYDSVHFTAQDIDKKYLNDKNINKNIKKYNKYRTTSQTNTFNLVIGTKTSSNLPDNYFDELFIVNSFHDFDNKDEMVADIYKKLKPNGRFILLEGYSFPNDTQVCPDYGPHILNTWEEEVARFERFGLYLTKMRSPNFKAMHYGNALMFEKDKYKSEAFYKSKKQIDELVSHAFRFKQTKVASDSVIMKAITDSIQPQINAISSVYKEFELWIKDLGLKHLIAMEYEAAANIFKANLTFFPSSYQTNYWLALAYEKMKDYTLSLKYYKLSLKLNAGNTACINKIKAIKKLTETTH